MAVFGFGLLFILYHRQNIDRLHAIVTYPLWTFPMYFCPIHFRMLIQFSCSGVQLRFVIDFIRSPEDAFQCVV